MYTYIFIFYNYNYKYMFIVNMYKYMYTYTYIRGTTGDDGGLRDPVFDELNFGGWVA